MPRSDPAKFLQQAKGGDIAAVGKLLEPYRNYLALIARMQIGKRLKVKVDAEDLVQETFLDAHRQFPNFRGATESELMAWLRQILAGQIATVLRRYLHTAARDMQLERELVAGVDHSSRIIDRGLIGNSSTPSQHFAQREQSLLLAQALDRLPLDYREVITLRHLEQLTFSQTAQRMERSEDSVQKLWMRAIQQLRKVMRDPDG